MKPQKPIKVKPQIRIKHFVIGSVKINSALEKTITVINIVVSNVDDDNLSNTRFHFFSLDTRVTYAS